MDDFGQQSNHQAPGDREIFTGAEAGSAIAVPETHAMDAEAARKEHQQLLTWYYLEREKQSTNRLEMAMDVDFYDNMQWDPDDAQLLRDRGQMPLVFNEVAPMVDWIIGTQRRARVDWKVLPRAEDDVKSADIKTKVLKYVADVNRVAYNRSRAFDDAVKAGVGWLDDGPRDDPTQDILYSKYEDWRNVLWDSSGYDHDLTDGRYIFRWRWVDEDIACMMFPERKAQILRAAQDHAHNNDRNWEEDGWQSPSDNTSTGKRGQLLASGSGLAIDATRRRVKLIESQYRMPVKTKIVASGPMKGAFFNPADTTMADAIAQHRSQLVDRIMMRVHVAVFTETDMLSRSVSIARHNRFSLTPVWCYRRGRDRLPYGVIRRVRDIQMDLNKRASKALFMLNTNQIIVDEGAVADLDELRDEADRPDGMIVKKQGKEVIIRRDTDAATGQIQMMTLDAQSIQKSAGVSQENMGRQTNAVSGEAIKARQLQGSVVTTEPFDNLRLATQIQGEKQLSLAEQFYTEEKVIRLTGAKGAIEWIHVNKPETQADGSVRYLNDITASMADFVVSEQDFAGTLRQVMFDSLNNMAQRLPPEVSLRLLTIATEFSDLPNKDEIANQIRQMTGDRDPGKELTPEEMQQQEQQMQQQQEAMQLQRETAMTALDEARAKVREINARAAKLETEVSNALEAGAVGGQDPGLPPEIQQLVSQIREQAATELEAMGKALQKAQADAASKTMAINKDADVRLELGRINADATVRVAEIRAASEKRMSAIGGRVDQLVAPDLPPIIK